MRVKRKYHAVDHLDSLLSIKCVLWVANLDHLPNQAQATVFACCLRNTVFIRPVYDDLVIQFSVNLDH